MAVREKSQKLVVSSCGTEGAGKNHFLWTAPRPIYCISVDPNTQLALDNYLEEGGSDDGITIKHFKLPLALGDRRDIQDDAGEVWYDVLDLLIDFIQGKKKTRTLALDTATDIWNLKLMEAFGKTIKILPEMRTGPNNEFLAMLTGLAGMPETNVVMLHRVNPVYRDKKIHSQKGESVVRERVEGEYERAGFSKVQYICNVEAMMLFDPTIEANPDIGEKFGMKVTRCTRRPSIIGEEWWGKTKKGRSRTDFSWLAQAVFPDTTEDQWR